MKTSVDTIVRSCSAARSGAPFSFARFPSPRRTVTSSSSPTSPRRPATAARAPSAPNRTTCESVRVRGENPCVATCTASSRFVLPTPFGPTSEHEPRLQCQLEPLVGAKVAERSGLDDQPGRRIGMTRYVKSSASSVRIAGRSGLISFIFTSSPSIDSSPSFRNSALKPISSGSPL